MWDETDGQLHREFKFKGFKQAFEFMTKVATAADAMNHHPRWQNEYDRVEIWLSTHDTGAITDKDRALAETIDKIYEESEN